MNQQFTITGQNNYKVDGVFGPTDYILPINATSTHFEEILKTTGSDEESLCKMESCLHKSSIECVRNNFQSQNLSCCLKGHPIVSTKVASDFEFPKEKSMINSKQIECDGSSSTHAATKSSHTTTNGSNSGSSGSISNE